MIQPSADLEFKKVVFSDSNHIKTLLDPTFFGQSPAPVEGSVLLFPMESTGFKSPQTRHQLLGCWLPGWSWSGLIFVEGKQPGCFFGGGIFQTGAMNRKGMFLMNLNKFMRSQPKIRLNACLIQEIVALFLC